MKWAAKDTTPLAMAPEAWSSHSLLALVPLSQLSSAQSSPLVSVWLLSCSPGSPVFLTGDLGGCSVSTKLSLCPVQEAAATSLRSASRAASSCPPPAREGPGDGTVFSRRENPLSEAIRMVVCAQLMGEA